MRTGLRQVVVAWWLCAAAAGCSAVVDPDVGKLGGRPLSCTPNTRNPCVCAGGAFGSQLCNAGGAYNTCECGAAGQGVAGSGAAGSGAAGGSGKGGPGKR